MKVKTLLLAALLLLLVGSLAFSQVIPYKRTSSLIVSDTSTDQVYRLTDLNLDGDYNDPGEIIVFFDNAGALVPNGFKLTGDARGYIYCSDSTNDIVWRLLDKNADGDANDPGEYNVYIDNTNLSGVMMSSTFGVAFDNNNDLWLVNAGAGGVDDYIALAKDLSLDGDCNDAGEIVYYFEGLVGGVLGASFDCIITPTDWLLVTDTNDANGEDSIFKFKDLTGDGDFYDAGEWGYFYDESLGPIELSSVFGMAVTPDGKLILNDSSADMYYMAEDKDGDGDVHNAPDEIWIYRDGTDPALPDSCSGIVAVSGFGDYYWDVYIGEAGSSTNPPEIEGVNAMRDNNGDGDVNDINEFAQAYDDAYGDIALSLPKGVCFMKGPWLKQVGTAQIGSAFDLILEGTFGDAYTLAYSPQTTSKLLPPMGMLRLGTPRNAIKSGTIGAAGQVTRTIAVPNNPNLVGKTFYFQARCGTAYLQLLSNHLEIEIQ